MTDMSDTDFQFYKKILLEKSGLALTPEKTYLLHTRLTPVAQSLGYKTLDDMTVFLRGSQDPVVIRVVMEAMTTNETSFFRDTKPFNNLREIILPQIIKSREASKTIRIWSAACSSGQEAYSTAIVVSEFLQDKPGWKCQIVGTDISEDILKIARAGEYNQFEVQRGLTIQMMVKYFTQVGTAWAIKDHLKDMVKFQYGNLLESSSVLGTFDIVFCRNVLIYFNPETKAQVLTGIGKRLAPDGFLLLGACETVLGLSTPFEAVPGLHGVQKLKTNKEQVQKSANL